MYNNMVINMFCGIFKEERAQEGKQRAEIPRKSSFGLASEPSVVLITLPCLFLVRKQYMKFRMLFNFVTLY